MFLILDAGPDWLGRAGRTDFVKELLDRIDTALQRLASLKEGL